jgi:hypothetical protein
MDDEEAYDPVRPVKVGNRRLKCPGTHWRKGGSEWT